MQRRVLRIALQCTIDQVDVLTRRDEVPIVLADAQTAIRDAAIRSDLPVSRLQRKLRPLNRPLLLLNQLSMDLNRWRAT